MLELLGIAACVVVFVVGGTMVSSGWSPLPGISVIVIEVIVIVGLRDWKGSMDAALAFLGQVALVPIGLFFSFIALLVVDDIIHGRGIF